MSNVIEFAKYKGRVPSGNKPARKEIELAVPPRCKQVAKLVVGVEVKEVTSTDEENFVLHFGNGVKLNLMIAIENDLMEVIKVVESADE